MMSAKKKPVKKAIKKSAKKIVKTKKTKSLKVAATKPLRTYIAFVLDYSSSMESIRAETIEHVNEQIERIQKEAQGMETKISLVGFNTSVDCHYFNESLDRLKPLTLKSYRPSGSTAMLDAIGFTIDRLVAEVPALEVDENSAALVVIVSDGQENASTKYTREMIAKKIKHLQNSKKWTFSYLGANQDLSQIHNDLHIPKGNISGFVASAQGMQAATAMSVNSTSNYVKSRLRGETQVSGYYDVKAGFPNDNK